MTDTVIVDFPDLVERYAARIRTDAMPGRELAYAGGFIDAMTDRECRHSLAHRQQKIQAVIAAAEAVRSERRGPMTAPVHQDAK